MSKIRAHFRERKTVTEDKQQGFSLIELVIVIVILGLLAATAIPRFLNITEDAKDASVEGVEGGLATAVSFVRSQWEVDGRNNDYVLMDGTKVALDRHFGFPTGAVNGSNNKDAVAMTNESCREVFNSVLQNAPKNTVLSNNADLRKYRYVVKVSMNTGGSGTSITGVDVPGTLDECVYYQVSSLQLDPKTGKHAASQNLNDVRRVVYNPGTGQLSSFTG